MRALGPGGTACVFAAAKVLANRLTSLSSTSAKQAGLTHKTVYGDEHKNKYLLETTGCGVALFDYDNDGWLDVFFVNGTRSI